MSPRPRDVVTLETSRGTFDRFSSVQITNSIAAQSEATFELGDDGSDADLYRMLVPGELFEVRLNGRPRLAGRVEVLRVAGSGDAGVKAQVIVRTKMADAYYCSADPSVRVENTSIKDFVLGQYAKLGYTEADFVFSRDATIDLMTGLSRGQKGTIIDLAPIKVDQAKASPTESVHNVVERHLKRHHAAHWDGPDGRIYVGVPDDEVDPLYDFTCRRGAASASNNVLQFERGLDWSQVPSEMWVYGSTPGKDVAGATIKGVSKDDDLIATFARVGHFNRPVVIQSEQAKSLAEAEAMARRERSARSRDKDTWTVRVDGWSHFAGGKLIPYAPNTTANVDVFTDKPGRYLVVGTQLQLSTEMRATSQIQLVAKGIWVI